MITILTNHIEANSFLGLITDTQKNNRKTVSVGVESKEVLRNLAIAAAVIIVILTAGSISQQKIEFGQYSAPVIEAAV